MLDKRCKYKVRETSEIYLFIKYPRSHIYYAKYPKYNVTKSTGCTTLKEAYQTAWEIYQKIDNPINLDIFKNLDKKRTRDLKYILTFLTDVKDYSRLSNSRVSKLQQDLLKTGISGKSVNNYCYLLKRVLKPVVDIKFTSIEHTPVYRSCFPVKSFYGFYKKCNSRLHYLAFFAMTTGCRLSEIKTVEKIEKNSRLYLKINGTKTCNAVREIPVLKETLDCMKYLENGFKTVSYKESVIEAGTICGFDTNYIDENHIVFHSFRKMYKTLLESCNIPNNFVEYYMGHSQTRTVNNLYFIGASADDDEVYPKVIDALKRFV